MLHVGDDATVVPSSLVLIFYQGKLSITEGGRSH